MTGSRTRTTRTYALVSVSEEAWEEVASVLREAGYADQINGGEIDMHGLALVKKDTAT